MKVMVAHNRYSSAVPSGENMVVDAEIEMLREAGVEVVPFIKSSDSLGSVGAKLKASTGPVWAPATRELARILDAEKPDVLHLHNVYPLISPWAVRTAKSRGVAVVQTMHNYRHQCVAGTHLREGKICEECTPQGLGLAAVKYGCYRSSRVQSAAMVTGRRVHRSTWQMVDRYFALTPFMAQRLVAMGIEPSRVVERPTSCPDPGEMPPPTQKRLLFVGRLDEAKGIPLLLEAWTRSTAASDGWTLAIVGSGPLEERVRSVSASDPSVVFRGRRVGEELTAEYRDAPAVVVPSIWFEGYPRVIAEAFAHGRTVIGAQVGSLATVLPDCPRWSPTVSAWEAGLNRLDGLNLQAMGSIARMRYLAQLTPNTSLTQLLAHYRTAVA